MANRLERETSPYLLQHRDNPIDWYPWGAEAFERARAEGKPIFLSVGYSACHWCHVMERESFRDPEIAGLLNRDWISVKVDREERPDVDAVYMTAVQAMTGQGGWPMSVFMTPDGAPFYAGTYFPPSDRGGAPGFGTVLRRLAGVYRSRRDDVVSVADRVVDAIGATARAGAGPGVLERDLVRGAVSSLAAAFDEANGGFGPPPRFPQPAVLELLLRHWHAAGDERALRMATRTLTRMAAGGIRDQLGGGFHRYATDARWRVPHFEKMLCDNALLASLYLHAWQATGDGRYREVVETTLEYVEREMLDGSGGFRCAQDADSQGEEGRFYLWSRDEVELVLGAERAKLASAYYGLDEAGGRSGRSVLWVPRDASAVAGDLGMGLDAFTAALSDCRRDLRAAREGRVRPGVDDKVVTSWSALMVAAFAEAGAALANDRYVGIARRGAEFLTSELVREGRVLRTRRSAGGTARPKVPGYLEDYACLVHALLNLYEATFDAGWLDLAADLADRMIGLFWDADSGLFFDTGRDHERLVARPRTVFDGALPSGGSTAAHVLLKLSVLTGCESYRDRARLALESVRGLMERAPSGLAGWLCALDLYTSAPREIAVIGPRADPATRALLAAVYSRYLPDRAVAGAPAPVERSPIPLLEGRTMVDGRPTAYVCRGYACQPPVTAPEALAAQLSG